MDFDYFHNMKVDDLKSYLRISGLKFTRKKSVPVAQVFETSENNIPLVKSAEEVETELEMNVPESLRLKIYKSHPFKWTTDWLSEDRGISDTTIVSTVYIIQLLTMDSEIQDLKWLPRLENV